MTDAQLIYAVIGGLCLLVGLVAALTYPKSPKVYHDEIDDFLAQLDREYKRRGRS